MTKKMKRMLTLPLIGVLGLCLSVSTASAGPFYAKAELMPTQVGYEVRASGQAQVSLNIAERFVVEVTANLKDGTVLIVSASTATGETFDVGAISLLMGSGKLELDNFKNVTSPAFPVHELESVTVSFKGEPALTGKFISASNPFKPKIENQATPARRSIEMK